MKKRFSILTLSLATLILSAAASAVESLRGEQIDTGSTAPEKFRVEVVQGGIERSYKEQPPMIPHDISKYDISLRQNGCLKCHSPETYEKEKAPKVGDSHFLDRDGNKLDKISSRRYFCTQCHTVQFGGGELVDNTFQGRK